MKNLVSAKELRRRIHGGSTQDVDKMPGIYCWWFADNDDTIRLLNKINPAETDRIRTREINGVRYLALYFGIAKNLSQRLAWHIAQKHSHSTVSHGFLSTLRQTLSALLEIDMTASADAVNNFMDANCFVEFENTQSRSHALQTESVELTQNYYPLNLQGNKAVERTTLQALSQLRKSHKK